MTVLGRLRARMAPARVKWLTVGGELAVAGGCLAWGFSTGWAPLAAILPTWASLSLAVPVAAGVFGTPAPASPSAGVLPAPPGGAAPYGAKLVFMPRCGSTFRGGPRGVFQLQLGDQRGLWRLPDRACLARQARVAHAGRCRGARQHAGRSRSGMVPQPPSPAANHTASRRIATSGAQCPWSTAAMGSTATRA